MNFFILKNAQVLPLKLCWSGRALEKPIEYAKYLDIGCLRIKNKQKAVRRLEE